jgi:adenosylmethionine-8-amino-7-oxononanoate aminotransferase
MYACTRAAPPCDARDAPARRYEHEIGVLLVEPQWGSSVAAMPWPPALLQAYIAEAKSRGIAVVSDEIMCGLGRHGAQPTPGGTGCFLTECWELTPDVRQPP